MGTVDYTTTADGGRVWSGRDSIGEEGLMSLPLRATYVVPEDTARVARAAFPKGRVCLRGSDELGTIFTAHEFVDLFAHRGQIAAAPCRLAVITGLPLLEGRSERQAAEAVRARLDGKSLLCLEAGGARL
jgi:hypothetical protein